MYNQIMDKEVIHISEAEAATTNVATLLAHVRAGAEVVIENGTRPVAVLRSAEPHPGRLLSESIAVREPHPQELRYETTLDPDFAADLHDKTLDALIEVIAHKPAADQVAVLK